MRSMRIDCAPVRIATWEELEAYMDGSAGSVGRIMAPLLGVPARHHAGYGRLGLAFQLDELHPRRARGHRASTASTCPRRSARASASAERDLARGARLARAARAASPSRSAARAACSPRRRPRSPPRRASVRPGVRLAVGIYRRVLDRAEQVDFDVLGRRAGVRPWQLPGAAVEAVGR